MEQTHFYLTITGDGDAHAIKERYGLDEFDAYNKGEYDESLGVQYQSMCLRYPTHHKMDDLGWLLTAHRVSRLLSLPKSLTITLYGVCHVSDDCQSHGVFLDVPTLKELALLGANFVLFGKLYPLSMTHDYPHTIKPAQPKSPKTTPRQYAYLAVQSYRHTLDELASRLRFACHDSSFNVHDDTKHKQKRPFTSFKYYPQLGNHLDDTIRHLAYELCPYQDNILRATCDLDIACKVNITGTMSDDYRLSIDKKTLLIFATMQLSLDFDMYF